MPKRKQRSTDGVYERPDSPVFWLSYRNARGQRIREPTEIPRTLGAEGREEARRLIAKRRLEVYRQREWGEQPERTFDQLMLKYLNAEHDKRSHRRDLDAARHLRVHFTGQDLRTLSAVDIRSYIEVRRQVVKPATVNRELCLLSAAINYARREWEWEIPNPVTGRKLKTPEGQTRSLSRAEAQALIRTAELEPNAPHLAGFIRLALHTGCRKQELLGLEWRRVDLQGQRFHLEGMHTKTGKRRSIPLNRVALRVIMDRARFRAQHCPGSPWVFAHPDGSRLQDVKKSFQTACRRAGITDFRIHDLRHTCASWLVTAGVPLTEVRDLLGHSTVKMTERYGHLAPENIRAAVARLEGSWSRTGHVDGEDMPGVANER